MRFLTIFMLAMSIHLYAGELTSERPLIENLRPFLLKVMGEEWTVKLLGISPEEKLKKSIQLPSIPKIVENSKSTEIYSKKPDKISLAKDLEEKFYYTYVMEIYQAVRQQKPNDNEVTQFLSILYQGGSREGVYRSLVLDSTYAGMENYDKPVKINSAEFAMSFYEKYIGRKLNKESLKEMNAFTLKRLLAEKALEIIDAFGDNRDDLEKWYAVLSAELAEKFPMSFTSKTRKETSPLIHKNWASKVPVQHIKSETLIKLHTVLNSMM